jgi:hypothetical protein
MFVCLCSGLQKLQKLHASETMFASLFQYLLKIPAQKLNVCSPLLGPSNVMRAMPCLLLCSSIFSKYLIKSCMSVRLASGLHQL